MARCVAALACAFAVYGAGACEARQVPVPAGAVYVASSRGEAYYWVECDAWRSLAPGNLRWFSSAAEAEAAGYRRSQARGCAGPEHTSGPGPAETGTCTIERVVDGDSVSCREAAERVRLLLIDTPELDQTPYGEEARVALERLLPAGSVARVELDIERRDGYGRLLAYLYLPDGRMANVEMARLGYAVATSVPPNVRHLEQVRAAVEEARAARRGLWAGSAFDCSPADHRAGRCRER